MDRFDRSDEDELRVVGIAGVGESCKVGVGRGNGAKGESRKQRGGSARVKETARKKYIP